MNGEQITWGLIGAAIILMVVIILKENQEYILKKVEALRKNPNQSTQPGQTVVTKKPQKWPWLIISVAIVLGFITAVCFAIRFIYLQLDSGVSKLGNINVPNFSLPSWLNTWLHSVLFWLILILIILIIVFRKWLRKKAPSLIPKKVKKVKWGWVIFWIVVTIWAMPKYIIPLYHYLTTPSIKVEPKKKIETGLPYAKFTLSSDCSMEIGKPYEFYQDDGKTWEFEPKYAGEIVYRVIKLENTTRTWTIKRIKDSLGNTDRICLNEHQNEPYDEAKRGDAIIILQSYSGSPIVIAKRKE